MNDYSTLPTRKILDALGSPDEKLKIIHIAGTNGKGSTAEYFTQILVSAKKKVGTFTSPQVYSFNDQFRINGRAVEDGVLKEYFAEAEKYADGASEFEIQTAGAIYAFYKEGCEWAVIECGMGGLNDATNAVLKKELAVITSVSLEHTEFLGDTLEKICRQKAGIIKNCPVVVNAYQPEEVKKFFGERKAIFADESLCDGFEITARGSLQAYNAATAIAGARLLGIDERAIYSGVKRANPCGRLQVFERGGRRYVLDGAHNPAAFEPLAGLLKNLKPKDITLIFGCLSDKDIDGNLSALKGLAGKIIAVKCPSPRATDLTVTVNACEKYFNSVERADGVEGALNKADTQTVVVCGSFTLLKEAKLWIEKES